ncbi:hypothetical protein N6H18_06895 [Reichenbachiella agarivorans]|uniref:Uncharacterized protein n=1 Tax=Reichenbachiella agarivorans TaxID=2979464 RepID=A0ABY6CTM2_9BACT|nr:DUF6686 family protein [Reichenbachiella agarivorans]UXP33679.1 hypothetical protein N6H18_06895 [Reichenbachiella agarivorans]
MSKCKAVALVEGANYCISRCTGCGRFGIYYKNVLIGFSQRDFMNFSKRYCEIEFHDHVMLFPDMVERVLIKTPHPEIQLNLDYHEFEELGDILQQCGLILEARALV